MLSVKARCCQPSVCGAQAACPWRLRLGGGGRGGGGKPGAQGQERQGDLVSSVLLHYLKKKKTSKRIVYDYISHL